MSLIDILRLAQQANAMKQERFNKAMESIGGGLGLLAQRQLEKQKAMQESGEARRKEMSELEMLEEEYRLKGELEKEKGTQFLDVVGIDYATGEMTSLGKVKKQTKTFTLGKPTPAQTEEEKQNIKKKNLAADINDFLVVDKQIPRGSGIERIKVGMSSQIEGIKQESPVGMAVAQHDAATKRLRVQLVRAAGDVGNINVVEQQAAEKMIPTIYDSQQVVELKRTYLQQVAKATKDRDPEALKDVFKKAGVKYTSIKPNTLKKFDLNGEIYTIPANKVNDFLKDNPEAVGVQ